MESICFACKCPIGEDEQWAFEDAGLGCHRYHRKCLLCARCGSVIESAVAWFDSKSYHPSCFVCDKCGRVIGEDAPRTTTDDGNLHWECFAGKQPRAPKKILTKKQYGALAATRKTPEGTPESEAIELLMLDYSGELGEQSDLAERLVELESSLPRTSKYRALFDALYKKWEAIAGPW